MTAAPTRFSTGCRMCSRLARHLEKIRSEYLDYHAKPVAAFGDAQPRLLIVGLAPGMHGANRTGRPFTGDHAGILLYETLYRFGFSNQSVATGLHDGLRLSGCRITNAVKCLPPQNKPRPEEVRCCNAYLRHEIAALPDGAVILALGTTAHRAVLMALDLRAAACPFQHGAHHRLQHARTLYDSYHCSRYNTQTKRLTTEMFQDVFAAISQRLKAD